ncbi:hypothetical protein [Flagellimonas marina]|uniref:Uncharacterized protein n=1 Tax=Flagellimonas marina TaxID=1775168 RepID=A0ABV8PH98_9FLAO
MKENQELRFLETLEDDTLATWPTWFMSFGKSEGFFFDPKATEEAVKICDYREENGKKYFKKSEIKKVFKEVLIG